MMKAGGLASAISVNALEEVRQESASGMSGNPYFILLMKKLLFLIYSNSRIKSHKQYSLLAHKKKKAIRAYLRI